MSKTHEIKINQEYAEAYYQGIKSWELRKNDRDYKPGDTIRFQIRTPGGSTVGFYERKITYVFKGGKYGLAEGYCILSIECNDCINYDLKNNQ